MKTNYVLGFCFNEAKDRVALIEKLKPEWQKGFYNGIGGKIEDGESSYCAMSREFKEETGVDIDVTEWELIGKLDGDEFCVWIFRTFTDLMYNVASMEKEQVRILMISELPYKNVIPNLHWIIPSCLIKDFKYINAIY